MKRAALIAVWMLGATYAWMLLVYGALRVVVWLNRDLLRLLPLPVVLYGLCGIGSLAVMGLTAFLGLRGKLPGTRKRAAVASGFPVQLETRTGDAE